MLLKVWYFLKAVAPNGFPFAKDALKKSKILENPMPPIYWTFSRLWASLRVWWELVWWQWWRVEKYPSPPETTINTGVLGDKMKGEGYFAYSISENWKQRRQERYCFLPHYNSSELYSICFLLHSYKKFPQFFLIVQLFRALLLVLY